MENTKIKVTIDGDVITCHRGIRLDDLLILSGKKYALRPVVARVNGTLQEMFSTLEDDARVEYITTSDMIGHQCYRRTATLILTKAVTDVLGISAGLKVQFSVQKGYYCELMSQRPVDAAIVEKIETRMREIIAMDLPVVREEIKTAKAIELFKEKGMYAKANVMRYRRHSTVNIYWMDDICDYYYGYMAPSSGYVDLFHLIPFKEGFVLQMPSLEEPDVLPEFKHSEAIYNALKLSTSWSERLNILNVGQLNDTICNGQFLDLMLVCEALQESYITWIAQQIYEQSKRIVLIAGPSSSGKTTFSHRLSVQLRARGLKTYPIAVDDYFVDRDKTPLDEDGKYNFECLEAIDIDTFNKDLADLLAGKKVELPTFNFVSGKREYGHGRYLQIGDEDILVIEGIHCLNEKLTAQIPADDKFRIYISALQQLNLDEHNRIPTTDGRLIRRIVRDAAHRGTSAAETISMWHSVRRGEEENIFPFQDNADVQFNSALLYELSVLKLYAEPLLFKITRDQPEYDEAKRLLRFLDYFVGAAVEELPRNSIIREFVGGSYFNV